MEFVEPDMSAPLDVAQRVAKCPPGEVKGMFFQSIAEEVQRVGKTVGRERYVAFRGYPVAEWLEFLPEAARAVYPMRTEREGVRAFGRNAYGVFLRSTVGRVLLSMAGQNVERTLSLVGRAFQAIGSHGSVTVIESGSGRGVIRYEDVWDYIDAWHVGIYEGGLAVLGARGTVRVRMRSISSGDIELRWS